MHRAQEQVRDFHRACDLGAPGKPQFNWEMLRGLRKTQIKEETKEFYDALDNQDALNAIQELCDILYVVYGAAVVMGVDLEPFFEAIHEANMKKVPGPKREDGKQLKPEGWVPADMKRTFIDTYNFWAPKS